MPGNEPQMAIIGLGRLGTQLALALAPLTLPEAPLLLSSSRKLFASALAEVCQARSNVIPEVVESPTKAASRADLVWLCVPDRVLPDIADDLAQLPVRGKVFVHCSGAAPVEVLAPLRRAGALTGAFHPLQSFTSVDVTRLKDSPDLFAGISFGIDADEPVRSMLQDLARALGGRPIVISPDASAKAAYHAAAVLASNALVTLVADAVAIMGRAGIAEGDARRALLPLVRGTLGNLESMPAGQALTGPVARGDLDTIDRHLNALADDHGLLTSYVHLAVRTVHLALNSGRIDRDRAEALMKRLERAVLDEDSPTP